MRFPSAGHLGRQAGRFAVIGVASTAAYAVLYLLARPLVGDFAANTLALLITAVANTEANRRLTFGIRGGHGLAGDHAVGLLAFGAGLALTNGSLAVLHIAGVSGRWVELAVLTAANAAATVLRFVALRLRLHRRAHGPAVRRPAPAAPAAGRPEAAPG